MVEGERRPWTQHRRLAFIEWKLFWEGALNRADLEQTFAISTPQASVDIREYRASAGDNIEYSGTEKAFLSTPKFKPHFLQVSADRLLLQLRAWLMGALPREELWFRSIPSIDVAPDITRHVDAECLRRVLRAMRRREGLEIRYQSLTNSRWRTIAPHALAYDGFRWHVRAWACDRHDFRDFVLTRIDQLGTTSPVDFDVDDDIEWNTKTTLRIVPHPGLTEGQSLAVQRDYNMFQGCREVEVRLSLAYYYIKRMNLDLQDLPPVRVQLRLENFDGVKVAIDKARAESRARTALRMRTKGGAL